MSINKYVKKTLSGIKSLQPKKVLNRFINIKYSKTSRGLLVLIRKPGKEGERDA